MRRIAQTLALALLLATTGCVAGPAEPDGGTPGPADGGLTADGGPVALDAAADADGRAGDLDGAADALAEGPAADDPLPEPGYYEATQPNGCDIQFLTLTTEGSFETDGALPCDHPIPLGGRYGIVSRRLISYLRLHDESLSRQYPDLGTALYEYRVEPGLLHLRAEGSKAGFFTMTRIGDTAPAR